MLGSQKTNGTVWDEFMIYCAGLVSAVIFMAIGLYWPLFAIPGIGAAWTVYRAKKIKDAGLGHLWAILPIVAFFTPETAWAGESEIGMAGRLLFFFFFGVLSSVLFLKLMDWGLLASGKDRRRKALKMGIISAAFGFCLSLVSCAQVKESKTYRAISSKYEQKKQELDEKVKKELKKADKKLSKKIQ